MRGAGRAVGDHRRAVRALPRRSLKAFDISASKPAGSFQISVVITEKPAAWIVQKRSASKMLLQDRDRGQTHFWKEVVRAASGEIEPPRAQGLLKGRILP